MSRDSRRRRNDGEPSWYDNAVNADYQEEVMPIPKDKAGLVIGKKGWRIKDIKEQSGVKELHIKDDQVHLRGTEEQCANAKKIIDMILKVLFKCPFFVLIFFSFYIFLLSRASFIYSRFFVAIRLGRRQPSSRFMEKA